ncbi:hypothetical protein Tco_1059262 [Tanacetum coccineum]
MQNLETQLHKETLYEKNSKSTIRMLHAQFQKFIQSEVSKTSNYDHDAREAREDFKQYTHMEAQSFKGLIIQHMDSIERCIVKRALHEQEIQNRLKKINERKLQIQECKVQEVKASDASSGDKENCRSRNECIKRINSGDDTDIRPSYDTELMAENADDHQDERVMLANLIANLKLDIDENKKIQKKLRKANTSLTRELKECKSTLKETNRTLGESNRTRDRHLGALHDK